MRWPFGNTHEVKCISISSGKNLPGSSGAGSRAEIAVRAVEAGAGDLRHGAVGRDVREAHEPVRMRRIRRDVQHGFRQAEDFRVLGREGRSRTRD